jgi:hypothetical protein
MKKTVMHLAAGSKVQWIWMGRPINGSVREIYTEPIVKKIKETLIKRNGSPENPAYLVESDAGNLALKLQSELRPLEKTKPLHRGPRMFSD